jgi:glycyl-tRNA synthetase beta chain
VLRARFNDARFFWEFDQRVPLVERVELLEKVTFQKDLGSYAAKTERVLRSRSAGGSAGGAGADCGGPGALIEAVRLAKTDLTTELVKEFTELQGRWAGCMRGRRLFGERWRMRSTTSICRSRWRTGAADGGGALLAMADKADTIVGMFGLGLEPTGSKDPFALRRAANGIVKILAEAEKALYAEAMKLAPVVEKLQARREYRQALEKIATLRPHVDLFFDKVMVMVDDAAVRSNRLALIAQVLGGFSKIADFSEMVAG